MKTTKLSPGRRPVWKMLLKTVPRNLNQLINLLRRSSPRQDEGISSEIQALLMYYRFMQYEGSDFGTLWHP